MSTTISPRLSYILTAICGIVGAISLSVSFSINPAPPASLTVQQVLVWGAQHKTLISAGAWLQAFGSLLEIIFMLSIITLSNATKRLSSLIVIFSATAIMGVSLTEIAFYLSAVTSGVKGDLTMLSVSLNLIQAVQHAYVIAPAPANLLALGFLFLGSDILPRTQLRVTAYVAMTLGVALGILGLIGTFVPMQQFIDDVLSVQEVWYLAVSIALTVTSRKIASKTAANGQGALTQQATIIAQH